jgi:uncharacterized membrane protein YbaN (DUF454 family)
MSKYLSLGAVYGTGLAFLGYFAAGFGHGTYTVLGIVSAPMGIVGILFALISLPFLWTGIFVLLHRRKRLFAMAMLLHYLGAMVLLTVPRFAESFGDWNYLGRVWARSPGLLVVCFLWYAAGQIFVWMDFTANIRVHSRNSRA